MNDPTVSDFYCVCREPREVASTLYAKRPPKIVCLQCNKTVFSTTDRTNIQKSESNSSKGLQK